MGAGWLHWYSRPDLCKHDTTRPICRVLVTNQRRDPAALREERMDIEIKVHCTPEEARTFLGLPDVQPIQREMMERVAKTVREGMSPSDAFELAKPFMVPNNQVIEAMQKAFFSAMSNAVSRPVSDD